MVPSFASRRSAETDPEAATRAWLAKLREEIAALRRNLDDADFRSSRAEN